MACGHGPAAAVRGSEPNLAKSRRVSQYRDSAAFTIYAPVAATYDAACISSTWMVLVALS